MRRSSEIQCTTFWATVLMVAVGLCLVDRSMIDRLISGYSFHLDGSSLLSGVLAVASLYTLFSVVYHIIQLRVE
jgi:hypothetical protein